MIFDRDGDNVIVRRTQPSCSSGIVQSYPCACQCTDIYHIVGNISFYVSSLVATYLQLTSAHFMVLSCLA